MNSSKLSGAFSSQNYCSMAKQQKIFENPNINETYFDESARLQIASIEN